MTAEDSKAIRKLQETVNAGDDLSKANTGVLTRVYQKAEADYAAGKKVSAAIRVLNDAASNEGRNDKYLAKAIPVTTVLKTDIVKTVQDKYLGTNLPYGDGGRARIQKVELGAGLVTGGLGLGLVGAGIAGLEVEKHKST